MLLLLHYGIEIVQFRVLLILIELVMLGLATFGYVDHRFILNGSALREVEVPLDVLFRINRLVCELQGLWSNRMRIFSQRNCPLLLDRFFTLHIALVRAEHSVRLMSYEDHRILRHIESLQ